MDTYDIYEEYPELRDLKPRTASRRSSRGRSGKKRRRGGMSNGGKLLLLLLVFAAAVAAAVFAFPRIFGGSKAVVYAKDGKVAYVDKAQKEKYLAEGWYASPADITPTVFYAEDGSAVTAAFGDAKSLAKRGYTPDKSAVFTTMYSEDGKTLYVPNAKTAAYKANGWTDKLSDITKTLYKSDGSKMTVMDADAEKYLAEGWTDRLLNAAKKMVSTDGEEKFVFNDDVNDYIENGWTVIKRVVDPDQPMVALTFDDGPGKYTDKLLDCLDKNNSVATFYTLGYLVEAYPDAVKRAAKLGCEVSNHTWDHTDLTSVTTDKAAETVKKTSDAVEKITGKPTPTYRPCFGAYNAEVLAAIDLPAIMWSIDTLDWKTKNADATYNKIMSDVYDGAIILMHDIHQPTVEAACRVIPALIDEGYQLVTVQELLEYKCGGMENGKVYFDAFE